MPETSPMRRFWAVLLDTENAFTKHECALRAAALAYYGLLSLLPLLLFLIFLGSNLLASEVARQGLQDFLERTMPMLVEPVTNWVEQTLLVRGSIGMIGVAGLLWTASAVFTSLSNSMNAIWGAEKRSFWQHRLLALAIVCITGVLFLGLISSSAITAWLSLPGMTPQFWRWVNAGVDVVMVMALAWVIFRVMPNRAVDGRAALAGAGLVAVFWTLAKYGFSLYLSTGLPNYGLVYGSLASVIVLVLWVYISAAILLIGAVFGAALEREYWASGPSKVI